MVFSRDTSIMWKFPAAIAYQSLNAHNTSIRKGGSLETLSELLLKKGFAGRVVSTAVISSLSKAEMQADGGLLTEL